MCSTMNLLAFGAVLLCYVHLVHSFTNILVTNDDGWATAMVRQQYSDLLDAGYSGVLSAPAQDKSGTGSSTAAASALTIPCEFNTCPVGSPPEGNNLTDPRLNYVNSFPVDSVRYGIQTVSPLFFDGPPILWWLVLMLEVSSKPKIIQSHNLGTSTVGISGTVGAACEAAKEGVPSTAFSAPGLSHISYTDLSVDSADTFAARVFANLTVQFVNALLAQGKPYLPPGVSINVNYPTSTTSSCPTPSDFSFVLTRIAPSTSVADVETCGTDHLPGESAVVAMSGCFTSVSVMNATTKADVDASFRTLLLLGTKWFSSCVPFDMPAARTMPKKENAVCQRVLYKTQRTTLSSVLLLLCFAHLVYSIDILQTNDDGWATAMIRQQFSDLLHAGYRGVLSAPAQDKSGTGSSTAPATVLTIPCEFNSCPVGSPPEGNNITDRMCPRLNYVNSFPVDSVRYGIQTLSPVFFRGRPDFVVAGPNVGNNLGTSTVDGSGTVGAACEAAKEGVPSTAFSAAGLSHVSYTDLSISDADTLSARVFAKLTVHFVDALLAKGKPYLPPGVTINVNYPASTTTNCSSPSDFSFILTRIAPNASVVDVKTCGTDHLPGELAVVAMPGCFASVSVMNATTKTDVDARTQKETFVHLFLVGS
ncbi:hypothetical protein D9757_003263 [Collybiopsis confluens]|uniref:Survival protein SurE-like phosphatase/nucleotidase domain-containing protein n=1 Tax=Collybiopsis confluens TaxID=2823264 RepID=A0A8H5HYN4_9AGAR|nr:hypothetical protein D9757_003263 [Collybiopsis confluens]